MRFIHFILVLLSSTLVLAQTRSSFNQKIIEEDTVINYSFLVSGHFYGGSNNKSGYPASTLLANLDWINNSQSKMLICLGDLFMDVKNDRERYQSSLFSKLDLPLFNSPGNHDLTGEIYQKSFGETSYYFEIGADFHLILDTEENNGDISDKQLDLLKEIKKNLKDRSNGNLFIYLHRTIWKDSYPEMDGLFMNNTQSLYKPNFEDAVLPILIEISKNSPVYCFSGSIGGDAPSSFFYHKDSNHNLTYIATAIRALPRDAMLKVMVCEGKVLFETHSLTGQENLPLESYNVDFWQTNSGAETFNWRLMPLYVSQVLLSFNFWMGSAVTLVFVFIFNLIRKRRKKRRLRNISK